MSLGERSALLKTGALWRLFGVALLVLTFTTPGEAADNNVSLKREHRGINLIAIPPDPGKTFDTALVPAKQGLAKLASALDRLIAKSPLSARSIATLKQSGTVTLVYLPDDLKNPAGGENVAAFLPDYLQKAKANSREIRFLVVVGRHGIKWPADELAATLAHELVGHGMQHRRGRLSRVRAIDAECEAYLYEEIANQDLGLNKFSREMVAFRRALEERWCADFKLYLRNHQAAAMPLWDVLNPDVAKLLKSFEHYLSHSARTGKTGKAIKALKTQIRASRKRELHAASPERIYRTARDLRDGAIGVSPDRTEALRYFHIAAEKGHPRAWLDTAAMYEKGVGIRRNLAKALKWYRKAAANGDAEAQYRLGWYLYRGVGVEKDMSAAAEWVAKAAANGHAIAQNSLGWMYTKGNGVEKDLKKAAKYFAKAAREGQPEAQARLGYVYAKGIGVLKDNAEAYEWYGRAAENQQATSKLREEASRSRDLILESLPAPGIASGKQ